MNISFLTHGSSQIGMGHIMRCLALGDEFRQHGHNVAFISKFKQGISRIEKENFRVVKMKGEAAPAPGFFYGDKGELGEEAKFLGELFQKEKPDVLMIDSYNVSGDFFASFRDKVPLVAYIDDLNAFPYEVDILINGTASGPYMGYEKAHGSENLLLGLSYNMLRKEFTDLPVKVPNREIQDILVTTGGSDPCFVTEKILHFLSQSKWLSQKKIHVVLGDGFAQEYSHRLKRSNRENLVFYEAPERMSLIMLNCDAAIAAGGSTLYELAACGIPTLAFQYAPNQRSQIKALADMGLLESMGGYENMQEMQLTGYIRRLEDDYEFRSALTKKLQQLVDGKGNLRIREKIEALYLEILMIKRNI